MRFLKYFQTDLNEHTSLKESIVYGTAGANVSVKLAPALTVRLRELTATESQRSSSDKKKQSFYHLLSTSYFKSIQNNPLKIIE